MDGTRLAGEGYYQGGDGIGQVGVGLVNDWVGMWMAHVLQERDAIKGMRAEAGVGWHVVSGEIL